MKIYGITNNIYCKRNSETPVSKASNAPHEASKTDRVEISPKAYELHTEDENLTASSGKDTLGITKGSEDGSFVIHFSDSAIVSRAVSRGYVTVNGTRVELTGDIKKELTRIDRQAQADRERAFNEYIVQHELAVSQQQSESYQKAADDMSQAFETAAKISNGGKVSPSQEQQLLEMNPQLYAMAKIVASMAKQQQKQGAEAVEEPERDQESSQAAESTNDHSIEWKSYETRLTVSLSDPMQLPTVSEGEIDMKI